VASLTDNGATVQCAAGGTFEFASASDQAIASAVTGGGSLVKSGGGNLTVWRNPSAQLSSVDVKAGTLTYKTAQVPWKHWKFVFCDVYNREGNELTMAEIAVFDQTGSRLNVTNTPTMASRDASSFSGNQDIYLYDAKTTQGWLDATGVNWDDLAQWKYASFSLSDAAPAVASYNLRTASYVANGRPISWRVYARVQTTDDWTLLDEKTNVESPSSTLTWYSLGVGANLAIPQDAGTAAFPASAAVSVMPGATLDLTYAKATTLGLLRVDATGATADLGTIDGGTLATGGTLELTCAPGLANVPEELPLKLANLVNPAALAGWTLTINGSPSRRTLALDENGQVCVVKPGFSILVR